jgi:hypothetical protein
MMREPAACCALQSASQRAAAILHYAGGRRQRQPRQQAIDGRQSARPSHRLGLRRRARVILGSIPRRRSRLSEALLASSTPQPKRAIVVESRGGLYSEGPAKVMDSQEPHLRSLLGFMGITNVVFVRAEKLAFGPEAREKAIDAARAQLAEVIQKEFFEAA